MQTLYHFIHILLFYCGSMSPAWIEASTALRRGQAICSHVLIMTILLLFYSIFTVARAEEGKWLVLSDDLSHFQQPTGDWYLAGNVRLEEKSKNRLIGEPGRGILINGKNGITDNLVTKEEWSDVEIMLDFLIPAGSNSGVKLQSVYEIQIADTENSCKPTGSDCGGIYPRVEIETNPPNYRHIGGIAPLVNAAKAAGEWQTLEIVFRGPRFDETGRKKSNARFEKVFLNDKLIHENVEVPHPTEVSGASRNTSPDRCCSRPTTGQLRSATIRVRGLIGSELE